MKNKRFFRKVITNHSCFTEAGDVEQRYMQGRAAK